MKNKKTFLKYYLSSNNKYASIFCIIATIISIAIEVSEGSDNWWYGLFFLVIGVVITPAFAWMNYKGYWV